MGAVGVATLAVGLKECKHLRYLKYDAIFRNWAWHAGDSSWIAWFPLGQWVAGETRASLNDCEIDIEGMRSLAAALKFCPSLDDLQYVTYSARCWYQLSDGAPSHMSCPPARSGLGRDWWC